MTPDEFEKYARQVQAQGGLNLSAGQMTAGVIKTVYVVGTVVGLGYLFVKIALIWWSY